MLLLASTSDKLQVVTGQAVSTITIHADFVDNNTSTGAIVPDSNNFAVTTAATTDVIAAPGAGVIRNVKQLHVFNTHASAACDITVQHTDGTSVARLYKVTLGGGESLQYIEGVGFRVYDASGLPKTVGITTGSLVVARLGSDFVSSSTTAAEVTGLTTSCPAGTYFFRYALLYQTAATTTGFKASCNHSGTVTRFVYNMHFVDNLATASSAAADQDAIAATAQVYSAYAARGKSTGGTMVSGSVDTANADMFALVEGLAVVTVDGTLQLYWGSEVAASNATLLTGSSLILTRTA